LNTQNVRSYPLGWIGVSTHCTSKDGFLSDSQFNNIHKNNSMLHACHISYTYYGKKFKKYMDHPNPDKTITINNGQVDKPKEAYTHICDDMFSST